MNGEIFETSAYVILHNALSHEHEFYRKDRKSVV